MKNIRTYLLVACAIVLFGACFLLNGYETSHAQLLTSDVRVVNTPNHAVPVAPQGTTEVAGSVSIIGGVNIANQPVVHSLQNGLWSVQSQQSGAWNVGITGTPNVAAQQSGPWNVSLLGSPAVQVNTTPTSPLYVRDVDNPALQPFQRELDAHITSGQLNATDSFTVPAGKRLVIEFASTNVLVPGGQHMLATIQTTTNGSTNQFYTMPALVCTCGASGSDLYVGSQQVNLYADPGSTVTVTAQMLLNPANSNTGADIVMSGHYVNVP